MPTSSTRIWDSRGGAVNFGMAYFPDTFTDEPAPMHHHMARVLTDPAIKLLGLTGPSGGAKSAIVRTWMIDEAIFGDRLFHGAVVGPIDKVAIAQLTALRKLVSGSDGLREDLGGEDNIIKRFNATELELFKKSDLTRPREKRRTCLIRAAYPGTPVRSLVHTTQGRTYRLQVASIDDAERKQDVGSEAVLRAFRAYKYDELIPRLDWAGEFAKLVESGNMSEHSALAAMFEGQPYTDPFTGDPYGPHEPSRVELYKEWTLCRYDCYLPDGAPYWSRWTLELLDKMRERLATHPGAFDRQYRQIARSSDDAGLPLEVFADGRCYGAAPKTIEEAQARWPGCWAVMAFDDAETVSRGSDYSAVAVVVVTTEGLRLVYLDERKVPVGQQCEWALGIHATWLPRTLIGEDPRLLNDIVVQGRKGGQYVHAKKVTHGNTPKRTRMLETLRPALINDHLKFATDRPRDRQIVREGCYPGAVHDDGADAVQMATAEAMGRDAEPQAAMVGGGADPDPCGRESAFERDW